MLKYCIVTLLFTLPTLNYAKEKNISVFNSTFDSKKYSQGQWKGSARFSSLPPLKELGVNRVDTARINLNTQEFEQVLDNLGLKKKGDVKYRIPLALVVYADHLIMDSDNPSFDLNSIKAISFLTTNSMEYGTFSHFFYKVNGGRLKPVNKLNYTTIDTPECSVFAEFSLHWFGGINVPKNTTVMIISDIETGGAVKVSDKEIGDAKKILRKVKALPNRGTLKRNNSCKANCDESSSIKTSVLNVAENCGDWGGCPQGTTACNIMTNTCKGAPGGDGWSGIILGAIGTIIEIPIINPKLYNVKDYLVDSTESSSVTRAYDAWDWIIIDTQTIPMYFDLIPELITRWEELDGNVNGSIVVDSNVKNLVEQVIDYHRDLNDVDFQEHLDYLSSKVTEYQYQTVQQVNTNIYPPNFNNGNTMLQ